MKEDASTGEYSRGVVIKLIFLVVDYNQTFGGEKSFPILIKEGWNIQLYNLFFQKLDLRLLIFSWIL